MNKLQRFVILRRHQGGQLDVIGTNSGQAFVEAAAEKHCARLINHIGGSFQVQEIGMLRDYVEANSKKEGTTD